MITKKSSHSVAVTMDRLEVALKEKEIGVVARVDHAAAAKKADMALKPT
jgi:D-alanyl-D-alanine carboxypeptidase